MMTEYKHEQPASDGAIARNILLCWTTKARQSSWWARLSKSKQRDLRQLLKVDAFREVLLRLTDFPGMWEPLEIGSLHRLLTMRCDEVRGLTVSGTGPARSLRRLTGVM